MAESETPREQVKDLKRLLAQTTSERLRRCIRSELRAALLDLQTQLDDVAELERLRKLAKRSCARRLLDAEIKALRSQLLGAYELVRDGLGDGTPLEGEAPSPSAGPRASNGGGDTASPAQLPAFCWRSPFVREQPIARCDFNDPFVDECLARGQPVVITGAPLCTSAVGKWSLDYLRKHYGAKVECTVFEADDGFFRYWDLSKNTHGYPFPDGTHTTKQSMTMETFATRARAAAAERRADQATGSRGLYLQSPLVEGVGDAIVADFTRFDWRWAKGLPERLGWGRLSSNMLFVGMRGHVTPAHFDEQQNLLAQLHGRKRVLLWRPRDWVCMYPYPVGHPNDRQSQVDFREITRADAPAAARWPRFCEASPLECVLQPGDVLYLPQFWWHHVENLDDECVSTNFWYVDSDIREDVATLPLGEVQNVAMRRNVERLIGSSLGSSQRAHAVLRELGEGKAASSDAQQTAKVARKLLSPIFSEEEVADDWIRELTTHRFW